MPTIITERLLLRDFAMTDWEAIDAFLSDPKVMRHMHFASYTQADRRRWFEWCVENARQPEPDAYNWAITLRNTSEVIGWLGIGSLSRPSRAGERDFGYALDRRFWGQGYMTEALRAVLAYEFEQLGAQRIFATCEVANIASARVMQKAGMHYEATSYDADFEGNWAQRHRYAISKQEFEAAD